MNQTGLAWALAALMLACGSHDDVVAIVARDTALEPDSDAGRLPSGALRVVGNPLVEWPFELAPWPLALPLAEFFSGNPGSGGVAVVVTGEDAELLRELWERVQAGEYGPQSSAVAVVDEQGSEYLIVVQAEP